LRGGRQYGRKKDEECRKTNSTTVHGELRWSAASRLRSVMRFMLF
jgi:hypothetical protein